MEEIILDGLNHFWYSTFSKENKITKGANIKIGAKNHVK